MGKNKGKKKYPKRNKSKNKVIESRDDRLSALRESKKNLKDIDKPRKPINSSFIAEFEGGQCPKCNLLIEEGQRVRYDNDGFLIHVRHEAKEEKFTFCDSCFLTLPCECEE